MHIAPMVIYRAHCDSHRALVVATIALCYSIATCASQRKSNLEHLERMLICARVPCRIGSATSMIMIIRMPECVIITSRLHKRVKPLKAQLKYLSTSGRVPLGTG